MRSKDISARGCGLLLLTLASACSRNEGTSTAKVEDCVVVSHEYHGCYSESSSKVVLRPVGDTFASETLVAPCSLIEAAREAAVASRERGRDVLDDLGVDPNGLDEAAARIAAAFFEHSGHAERNGMPELTALVEQSATPREIHGRLVREITVGPTYMASRTMEITLPGEPPITLTNESLSPFYLPWRVVAGDEQWTTTDVRLTRALAPLIWTDRSFDEVVSQWREHVWRDISIWAGLDDHAEAVLSSRLYTAMRGFAAAAPEWNVKDATCGLFALRSGETLFLDLRASRARTVDAVRWYVPIVEKQLASDWIDLLATVERAERAVEARTWLAEWKSAGGERSIELQLNGATPIDESDPATFVQPAWELAGFEGEPEFELLLRREGQWAATVFLAGRDARGLITAANPQAGPHWLDTLDVHFHPTKRELVFVDSNGAHHLVR